MKRGAILNFFTDDEAVNHLDSIGLKEITSERQVKNGTRCFLDTALVTSDGRFATMYTFHKSGAIRIVRFNSYKRGSYRWKTELINRRKLDKSTGRRIRIRLFNFSAQVGVAISTILQHRKNVPSLA